MPPHGNGALQPSSSTDENPPLVCYSTAGRYDVQLIAYNSLGSDTVTFGNYIAVSPPPPLPVISQIGKTLYCTTDTSYASYQWYDSTSIISGATDTFLVITNSGNYNIQITNHEGCKIAVGINVTGIKEFGANSTIYIYPNPATNQLFIQCSSFNRRENTYAYITNMLGQMLLQVQISNPQSVIDITSLSPGIYFLHLKSASGSATKMFVAY
jgi:PKD repeat protein